MGRSSVIAPPLIRFCFLSFSSTVFSIRSMHRLFYRIIFSRDVFFVNIFSISRAFVLRREDGENRGVVAEAAREASHADETQNFRIANL